MTEGSTATDIPEFPMTRAAGCPFAPPPKVLELNADKQLSRVRIWDDSTPWLDPRLRGDPRAVHRFPHQRRRPVARLSALE